MSSEAKANTMGEQPSKYFNRELSWLEFNDRVLDEALDSSVPLLERLRFLAITASNLDEFYMIRVGGLRMLAQQGVTKPDPAGMSPQQQLDAVNHKAHEMVQAQYKLFMDELEPQLRAARMTRIRPGELSTKQAMVVAQRIEKELYPIFSPIGVASPEDFPAVINLSLNVLVRMRNRDDDSNTPEFAVIPFGRSAARIITLPSEGGYEYILLEDAIRTHVERFFPVETILECVPFRITRNADHSVREDMAADLMSQLEEVLDARKQGECVRLEVDAAISDESVAFLTNVLDVKPAGVFRVAGPIGLSALMPLADAHGFDSLRYEAWPPQPSPDIAPGENIFSVLSQRDILLHHPYESFDPVVRLLEDAADDPDVLAIKQTLYRTSGNSPIVAALKRAAHNGKYVTAIVELKARFDEARNIEWARDLEQAEVQVFYGVKGLKTHAKVCVIVRREPHGIQRYVHFGTGNYNERTARLYADLSFMTSNDVLTADAVSFMNAITGYSLPQRYRKIEAAPIGLRDRLIEMIQVEIERKRHGQEAAITAKLNSLADPEMIDALYEASQAGVQVRLNIRGICCLRPGVPGLSENIRVVSIIDRFLEHSRILHFHRGGDDRVFISSADWMHRNLDRRIELLVPVEDPILRNRLLEILETYFADTAKAREILPDGGYKRVSGPRRKKRIRSQEEFYKQICGILTKQKTARRTTFEPLHSPDSNLF